MCVGGEDKYVEAGGAAPGVVPQELATFIYDRVSHWPETCQVNLASLPEIPRDLPVFSSSSQGMDYMV